MQAQIDKPRENLENPTLPRTDWLAFMARLVLGAILIYMGASKALEPVEFLKLVRQYDVLQPPFLLNLIAATLPWFEVFCGLLLVAGFAVRGTALLTGLMLIAFTTIIFLRAWAMRESGGAPFCEIRFDCGCGAGDVLICRKLVENALLTLIAAGLIFKQHPLDRPANPV